MNKKLRIRDKDDVKVMLWKMLPILFMILMFLVSTSTGAAIGPRGAGID
jgi:hypothetical protein